MKNTSTGSPAWFKDLLEFGHNIGLALALAGFGALAYHVEVVSPSDWNKSLSLLCIGAAIIWGAFSGNYLAEQLLIHTRFNSKAWFRVIIGGLCIGLGTSIVLLAPLIPDNNHIVALCDKYENVAGDKIHNSDECQRLYKKRADYERKLRGE